MRAHLPVDLDAALRSIAAASDQQSLWSQLGALREHLTRDPRVASLWLQALWTSPARPTLLEEAEAVLEAWPKDSELVGLACEALNKVAEARPIDEPPLLAGPASLSAGAAQRCFAAMDSDHREAPEAGGRMQALRASALSLLGPKRQTDALTAMDKAIATDPEHAAWHADKALLCKRGLDFAGALEAGLVAKSLGGRSKAIDWNIAIAATALGRAAEASDAWRRLGLPPVEREGELPLVEGLSPVQVRLPIRGPGHDLGPQVPNESAAFEWVFVQPLSPCHGVIRSPTFGEAVADFGDVVLWDGVPIGRVEHEGKTLPRFPLLATLNRGREGRFRFLALEQQASDVRRLAEALPDTMILYPHAERVERACPRCAAGDVMRKHEHLPAEDHRVVFGKLVVTEDIPLSAAIEALEALRREHSGVLLAVPGLYEAVNETAKAGKHHKRWGVIEGSLGISGPR